VSPGQLPVAQDASAGHLYEILLQRAQTFPDAIAVGGQQGLGWKTLNSRQLLEAVDSLADQLSSLGVRETDRVVLWVPNHWRTPVYLFALWKLGAVVVPFDREMNPSAGAAILRSIEPRCIIAGHGERPAWASGDNLTEWWDPLREPRGSTQDPGARSGRAKFTWDRPAEELAALFFTSGTTGDPKGCMITHGNLRWQMVAVANRIQVDPTCSFASTSCGC
jgi:long-chain acyl-CoA synthetase